MSKNLNSKVSVVILICYLPFYEGIHVPFPHPILFLSQLNNENDDKKNQIFRIFNNF